MPKTLFHKTIGTGPNLVLLHGWGFHSRIWDSIIPELAKFWCVTVIDLPGFGYSRNIISSAFSLENIANAVMTVAPQPASWLGWSFGGLVACQIASEFPERVAQLMMVASTPKFMATQNWPGISTNFFADFKRELQIDKKAALDKFVTLLTSGSSQQRKEIAYLKKVLFNFPLPDIDILLKSIELIQHTDLREDLTTLKCPTHFLLGNNDVLIPKKITQMLQQHHINFTIFNECSHILFRSYPGKFLRTLLRFNYRLSVGG